MALPHRSSLPHRAPAPARQPRLPLLVDDSGATLDGPAVEAAVASVAGGLRAAGVRHGDVVAWQAPNWHEVVVLYRACWRLGAIAGPIHHQAGPADVDALLKLLGPRLWLPRDEIRGPGARYAHLLDGEPVTRSAAQPH